MAKGDFDASVSQSGWFAPRSGGLTARSWFDRELVADTTVEAAGAVTFAAMSGTGAAKIAIDATGTPTFSAMAGTGAAAVAIAGAGAALLDPMLGIGALVIGAVNINAAGAVTFADMVGSGRLGIGSGVELRDVTIEQRVVEIRITVRR